MSADFSPTPREQLIELIRELAVVHGKVTLSSGREADYYVDLRRVSLHHRAAPLIGHVLLDHLEEAGLGTAEVDAVGGLTMGADPIATALLHAAASRGQDLDAFVIRKEAKSHGTGRRIEGPGIAGRRVVVVDDTTTTGGSLLQAVDAVRAEGAEVAGVATLVDRDTGAKQKIEALGLGYHFPIGLEDLGLA
ncbi:orotate phosphoribosyltransferase [Myceligenerans salitolerans]|uniref:Orotate phosphoribosyltransferase n=1 Tax=Myceligenerans salitolerans TaxID=1230528 RepID=A0ABS3I9T0_9MICO|nr:orotate phosphoribosyltransferase [Myceligenerans salitolerans]MBO0609714.1 orotate phosphoribosyltransferase [Myceligenerans salitolerans]